MTDAATAPRAPHLSIRPLAPRELGRASALAMRAFESCVAGSCPPHGRTAFASSVSPKTLALAQGRGDLLLGAFTGEVMEGMLVMRGPGHVANLFVDAKRQRRGIGRALFEEALRLLAGPGGKPPAMTVNASLFAVRFYERLGFVRTGEETRESGLRATPMRRPPSL